MATSLSYDLTYDAPASQVHAMLMDPAFREQVCDAQHATRRTASVEPAGDGTTVLVDQTLPAQGIPGFAKKIVGDSINLVQTEHWDDAEQATLEVVIPGKPGQMAGTIRLRESGGTTTETVQVEVRVSIPLVGGKVEALIADMMKQALRSENAVGRSYLGG